MELSGLGPPLLREGADEEEERKEEEEEEGVVLQMWTTGLFPVCPVAAKAPEVESAMQVMSSSCPANRV